MAIRADLFIPEADYRERMDTLIERVRACPKAQGIDEILIPGEPELREEANRRKSGIPYSVSEVAPLQQEAERAGVAPLSVSSTPLSAHPRGSGDPGATRHASEIGTPGFPPPRGRAG
jgi:hypothetical protein